MPAVMDLEVRCTHSDVFIRLFPVIGRRWPNVKSVSFKQGNKISEEEGRRFTKAAENAITSARGSITFDGHTYDWMGLHKASYFKHIQDYLDSQK